MIYCANCGTSLPDESRFCSDCGNTVTSSNLEANNILESKINQAQEFIETTSKSAYPTNSLIEEKTIPDAKELIYCRNCSNPLNSNAFACIKCGLPPLKGRNYCQCCGANTHIEAVMCVKCGVILATHTEKNAVDVELKPTKYHQPIQKHQPQHHVAPQSSYTQQNITVIGKQKSVGTAFLLAFLFGPLGLLYASVTGGLIMIVVSIVLGIVTLGVGFILTWIISIIWAVVAANDANSKMGK